MSACTNNVDLGLRPKRLCAVWEGLCAQVIGRTLRNNRMRRRLGRFFGGQSFLHCIFGTASEGVGQADHQSSVRPLQALWSKRMISWSYFT